MASTTFKYGIGGTVFGLTFPAVAVAVDAIYVHPGVHPLELVASNPLHWIILLAPVVLGTVFTYLGRHAARLADENARRAEIEGQLREVAFRDALTGLLNRAALNDHLSAQDSGVAGRYLVLVDLDRFKFVNDTMGHGAGDALLCGVAENLRRTTDGAGRVYRLGGDEFLVLLDPCSPEHASVFAAELVRAVSTTYDLGVGHIKASASLGIAPIERDDVGSSVALFNADLALYEAKKSPSRFAFFDSGMSREAKDRLGMELDLRMAIEEGQLFLEFQPIVTVDEGRLSGFEALLRWRHPHRGLVQPLDFIPVAESSGLIISIGQWVLDQACETAASWPEHIGVSVNVSIEQLKDAYFVTTVADCLARSGIRAERLTLEVTESLFILDTERVGMLITAIRELGVRIALDDFGTGYSSINHLRSFAFDDIKIDRSFAGTMVDDSREARLVKTIVQLGSALSMRATIEGIETEAALELARSFGIDFAQGFFVARPMAAPKVSDYIEQDEAAGKR